jgi:hypothetical protein
LTDSGRLRNGVAMGQPMFDRGQPPTLEQASILERTNDHRAEVGPEERRAARRIVVEDREELLYLLGEAAEL